MRLIAISIVVLAGAIMAVGGTIAEAMPGVKQYNIVDGCGLAVVAIGVLLFIGELLTLLPFSSTNSR
jgi:energy-converting hydrogenase Eha subunit E